MFEFVLAGLLSWPALALLVLFGILCEHNESRGWAVFLGLVASVVSFFYFKIPLGDIAVYGAGYLLFGVLWSFYRYKRFVVSVVAANINSSATSRSVAIEKIRPSKNLSSITAWIIIWPFSVIDNLIGDLISVIETAVKTIFKGVYNRIFDAAVADLTK